MSLISRIGARARANENHWAKKEQEMELQKRHKKQKNEEDEDDDDDDARRKKTMLLERRARGDDDDSNNNSNSTEYDGVTKLAEVYANELRLSAQAEARELRKHKRFDISEGNTNRGQRRAFPENDGMIRRRRDRWGFEAIKSD